MRAQEKLRPRERALGAALAASVLLGACLLGACASTGKSTARILDREGEGIPAEVQWRTSSPYGTSGQMLVTVMDGTEYVGDYRLVGEPNPETEALWQPWRIGWPDWPLPWEDEALPASVSLSDEGELFERYRGLTIANLRSKSGERLRCRFGMFDRTLGLAGGFDGDCQVAPAAASLRVSAADVSSN